MKPSCPPGRCDGARRLVDHQLQGRPGHHRQSAGGAQFSRWCPGIDFAGTVTASDHPRWKVGDQVVLNGFGVGEGHWGGLAQMARVKGDWLVALPEVLSTRDAMALGTAGYTAMLCVQALQRHWDAAGVKPGSGEVLVTGAGGGVGGVAIALALGHGPHRGGLHRPAGRGRLPQVAGCHRSDRPERPERAGQADAERALDRRGGFGRQPHPGQCLREHALRRCCGGLWPGARHGLSRLGGTVHLARRDALRHRQRDGALGQARSRLATIGARPGPQQAAGRSPKRSDWRKPWRQARRFWPGRCVGAWW